MKPTKKDISVMAPAIVILILAITSFAGFGANRFVAGMGWLLAVALLSVVEQYRIYNILDKDLCPFCGAKL